MQNYDLKMQAILFCQGYLCPVCRNVLTGKVDLHHRMRNTKGNRKRYPLMIDSVHNLEAVHHNCHIDKHGQCGKMSDIEAIEIERMMEADNGK
jgi:hypothetical protein